MIVSVALLVLARPSPVVRYNVRQISVARHKYLGAIGLDDRANAVVSAGTRFWVVSARRKSELPLPAGSGLTLYSVCGAGEILAQNFSPSGQHQNLLYSHHKWTTLFRQDKDLYVMSAASPQILAGYSLVGVNRSSRPFITTNGREQAAHVDPAYRDGSASGINRLSTAVGYVSVLGPEVGESLPATFMNGSAKLLPLPPGIRSAQAAAINDFGTTIGYGSAGWQLHAGGVTKPLEGIVWYGNKPTVLIPPKRVRAKDSTCLPSAINSDGTIVGYCTTPASEMAYAFVRKGGKTELLDDLVDPAMHLRLTSAVAVNKKGFILCEGHVTGKIFADVFLLSPSKDHK